MMSLPVGGPNERAKICEGRRLESSMDRGAGAGHPCQCFTRVSKYFSRRSMLLEYMGVLHGFLGHVAGWRGRLTSADARFAMV
jgi:hypothetical protein